MICEIKCLDRIALASLELTATTADLYLTNNLVYCGWGTTDNKPSPPRTLLCTNLRVIAAASCSANTNIICTKREDNDNNVCPGEFQKNIKYSLQIIIIVSLNANR